MRAEWKRRTIEWRTLGLAAVIYGGWAVLTLEHAALPLWFLMPAGAWFVAWQSSLQHETIHGHPTGSRRLDQALGILPLALWLPYERYRALHLAHHRDERLTDPYDDPESWYSGEADWRALHPALRTLACFQTTLLGRLTIGPAWSVARFTITEARLLLHGERGVRRAWLFHLVALAAVLAWLVVVCRMSLWLYIVAFAYPGTSLLLLRSFAEHRAAANPERRTAVVEGSPALSLLFLNNNLHAVHHARPSLPWYEIPSWYRRYRAQVLASNGGLLYRGYTDVGRRFLLLPHDAPTHPLGSGAGSERGSW